MITFFTLVAQRKDNDTIKTVVRKKAAIYTEEAWNFPSFETVIDAEHYLEQEPVLDLVCWDVTLRDGLDSLEKMRRLHTEAFLLVVADSSLSPTAYLKPVIAPGALLLKPVEETDTERVVEDIFEVFSRQLETEKPDAFLVETRDGKQYIPLGQIDYFEAREKKIFVRTKSSEFGFYDALDTLEEHLPVGFIRCHRSYIVNIKRAKTLLLSESMIQLKDDVMVPFSRSYKKTLKEFWKNG